MVIYNPEQQKKQASAIEKHFSSLFYSSSSNSFAWLAYLLDSSTRFKIKLICIGIVA